LGGKQELVVLHLALCASDGQGGLVEECPVPAHYTKPIGSLRWASVLMDSNALQSLYHACRRQFGGMLGSLPQSGHMLVCEATADCHLLHVLHICFCEPALGQRKRWPVGFRLDPALLGQSQLLRFYCAPQGQSRRRVSACLIWSLL
jgi:hypothetical protein